MKGRAKIFTYGCQMNDLDSQKMYSELSRIGYLPTGQTREADIIVINTCSVRQKAYEKAISNLGRFGTLKRENHRSSSSWPAAWPSRKARGSGSGCLLWTSSWAPISSIASPN